MKAASVLFAVFSAALFSSASAAGEAGEAGEMLKVSPPVADRPLTGEKESVDGKGAGGPAQPATATPTPSPAAPAVPPATEPAEAAAEPAADEIVSASFPVSRYALLWENSPFQNESIAPPQQSEGLTQRFVLGGILRENGEPVVWVRERATQQSFKVSRNATNNLGLSLVEVEESMKKQSDATATIRLGGEIGVIKFDSAGAGAVPGMGMAPAMPGQVAAGLAGRSPGAPVAGAATGMGGTAPVPGQSTPNIPGRPGLPAGQTGASAMNQPGVVPSMPGPGIPANAQTGQVQQPPGNQQQMPAPRVIRRRAIVPAAPSTP